MSDMEEQKRQLSPIWVRTLIGLAVLIGLNALGNLRLGNQTFYLKWDLTEEKRYSLTQPTRELIQGLERPVLIDLYLEGNLPPGFRRLQESTLDLLQQFRSENNRIRYTRIDPDDGSIEERNDLREMLRSYGVGPFNLSTVEGGERSEKQIFPYALVRYQDQVLPVNLLENSNPGQDPQVALNNSITLLEYKLANAIQKVQYDVRPVIAFTIGHGELEPWETLDLEKSLRSFYPTGRIQLDSLLLIPEEISVLLVAKPQQAFSEADRFKIDQYVMGGGKVIWMLDPAAVNLDSLQRNAEFFPAPYELNLDDLLFKYGIRLEQSLLLDSRSSQIQIVVGQAGGKPQFELFPYPFHPVAVPGTDHPIVKNIEPVNFLFPGRVDTTVQTRPALKKTPLLTTSSESLLLPLPQRLDVEFLRYGLDPNRFGAGSQPVAVLLEGQFTSLYANRPLPVSGEALQAQGWTFKGQSEENAMLVISDGDVGKNNLHPRDQSPLPLGFNLADGYIYANKDFLLNAIEYLLNPNGVIEAREKEVKLRLLDQKRTREEATFWQLINIALPIGILILFGLLYNWIRKRRYAGV